jgi:hypothetical protein
MKLGFKVCGEKENFRKRKDKSGGEFGEKGRNKIFWGM